ncbi:slc38a6 [Symbiodinium natans]|uniref:Slc38a6 protein n=1 Tax=Symbiodinium natans TaxID=878477 RepID=A0A812RUP6_9DINO|nr:slc38a6 [Symbiodinium natans]
MAATVLRHSPRARPPELQLLQRVLSDACQGHAAWPADPADLASQIARRIGKERPDLFIVVLPGPFMSDSQDMFGEGFDIFSEIQVHPQLIASVLARSPRSGPPEPPKHGGTGAVPAATAEVLLQTVPGGHAAEMQTAVAAALQVEGDSTSRASECYFALARQLNFKLPLFVLWRHASTPASSCNAAGERLALRAGKSVVDIFVFSGELGPAAGVEERLVLAPTGAGKSTWRTHAPVFCPEGEVMDEVTFHPAYHRRIRLKPGGWLSTEEPAPSVFLRDLSLLRRWLSVDRRRRVTFNCAGEVLEEACRLSLLQPAEVCIVLPPEAAHQRFLSKRKAAVLGDTRAKKFKADPSLSHWDEGPLRNRETLRAAAAQCGIRVYCSFAAAAGAAVHVFCTLRHQGGPEEAFLAEPPSAELEAQVDVTMACGRQISEWLSKGGSVAAPRRLEEVGERGVWQVSADSEESDAYIVKSSSGFLLLTDGSTLISAEDPYRDPAEVFWTRAPDEAAETADSSFWLCGRDAAQRLHARRCTGCASFDPPGPWRHALPVHRLTEEDGPVLWYPGSFAPFHLGHLNCLRAARHELQKQGIKVSGAYAKPQLPKSLGYKNLDKQGSSVFASGAVRLRLLELIVAQEDWVMPDPHGILRGGGNNFVDLRSFRANLQASLARLGGGRADWASSVEIIWVIGDDAFPHLKDKLLSGQHAPKEDALKQVGPFRMCVVHNRPSQWTALGPGCEDLPFPVVEVTAPPEFSADLSATAVRERWQHGAGQEELAQLLGSKSDR